MNTYDVKRFTVIAKTFITSLTALLLLLPSLVLAQLDNWHVLMEPNELSMLINSGSTLRIIHVTGNFSEGHIPGSANAPYAQFRGPQNNAGQLPSLTDLTTVVQGLGIDASTPVVVVHQGNSASDMGAATRVYWTLKSLGIQQLAVLNGGFAAWRDQQLPVSTTASTITPSDYQPVWNDTWQITATALEAAIEGTPQQPTMRLLDSRPNSFFTGQQSVAVRPGTIRGANNLSFNTWFDNNRLKPLNELDALFASTITDTAESTVTFCNTGHWASINWFVLSELAGINNTQLYAESVVDWAQSNRPMDNQPGRLAHYWSLTRSWMQSLAGSTP
ncbi:sulfurtransferase [Gammaproteobacteria bacterium LSUCC0112]|nr:sulfurtransferase [Gammaproteobacteria bacterium LSUCC0112]